MRLALLLAAALGVHADVQAPDGRRKAEIAKKVREFQEMTSKPGVGEAEHRRDVRGARQIAQLLAPHLDIFADRGYENAEKQSVSSSGSARRSSTTRRYPFTEENLPNLKNEL